jgi:peptidoglycan/xylan/chitin deacetylase (PgdA/CDA1 family)/GT2 family glycosyltransferase
VWCVTTTMPRASERTGARLVDASGRPLVPVLAYHAVAGDPPEPIRRWSVTPQRLREHLDALRALGAQGLTVTQLLACYRGERPLPARPVVLTFDDGYEDFLLEALPALDATGYPATLYASTGLLRDERPVLHTLPGRMLSWEQLRDVAAAGVEIGAHSHTHRELDTLSRAEATWEVTHSRARLEQELGRPVRTFAYPYGYSNAQVRAAVRAAGYEAACGVRNAYSHGGEDVRALSRILVERDLDAEALARLVTERVAPVGWPGEKASTRAWRTYRRARALRAAVTGEALEPAAVAVRAPVALRDVELARPLPDLAAGRAQVLVRLHGRPIGTVLVEPGESLAGAVSARLRSEIGRHLADDGLPPAASVPPTGLRPAEPWPCRTRPTSGTLSTTVVIPTCGRPDYVWTLVRSLLGGDAVPDEILVVDNRPTDRRTRELVERGFGDDARVRYLAEPVPGASRARNRGLQAAAGELVAFLDDDVIVDPGWLRSVREAWTATRYAGAVTGLILPAELDTAAQLLVQAYGGFDKGFTRRVYDLHTHRLDHPLYPYLVGAYGSGANAVFDRARLLRLGGFDERLGPGTSTRSGEDLDVLLRTVLDGAAVVYEPGAMVRHHHRPDYAGLRRMAYDYGVGLSALFVKHLLSSPRGLREIGRRLPAGLGLLLAPGSDRNANRREAEYPAELTLRELVGMLSGPVAFARSRRPAVAPPADPSEPAVRASPVERSVEYDVHGLLAVRLYDAPQHIVDAVTAELGPPGPGAGQEPDLTVRFVDELRPAGYLRLLGLNQAGFDDEHFYLLDAQGRRARVEFERLGERGEVVCERAIDGVPLLVEMVGLHLLRRQHVLLHSASFVHRGRGVLVAGWQKGGKTETLLPFMAEGAEYVADEWTVVGGDEPGLYGVSTLARMWDWQLRQVPQFRARIGAGQRARLRAGRGYQRLYRLLPRHDRVRSWPVRLLRQVSAEGGAAWQGVDGIPPAQLFGDRVRPGRAPLDRVFLPILGDDDATSVVPTTPEQVARRMVSALEFERAGLITAYQQFRFAFPDRANPLVESARERELGLLTAAFEGVPAYEIRHPYPVPLHELYKAAAPYC